MTRRLFTSLLACALLASSAPPKKAAAVNRPKLVVGIVIDQFRYDYMTRFRDEYNGGLDRLLRRGAVFTNARYEHVPTYTAVGHSTFMTGATPSMSGIVGNEWYDRATRKSVTSVSDPETKLLGGGDTTGSSPRRLVASTLGDEMKAASRGHAKVIGISIKDRASILPSGHSANAAYWFDGETGNFVSSTFYFADLPQWVKDYNGKRPADRFANNEWKALIEHKDYPAFSKKMPEGGSKLYNAIEASPYGNDLLEEFAERAVESEQLGTRGVTDLLTVSFSSNDYVGHAVGPDAPEVRDISIRTDRALGKFFAFLDQKLGLDNVIIVLTGDHGVAPLPEALAERKMVGGRLSTKELVAALDKALTARYGEGQWIEGTGGQQAYLNHDLINARHLNEAEVERTAANAIAAMPHIYRVYTREQLLAGATNGDPVDRRVINGFFPSRTGDVWVLEEPFYIQSSRGTTHGSPFGYDRHVPVIFMGMNVKPGRYNEAAMPNDIAPTLATMLDVETPSGSIGRVLSEMFVAQ